MFQKNAVEVRETVLAVQILVGEAGLAEKKVPLGEGWRRNGLQEELILTGVPEADPVRPGRLSLVGGPGPS